jgi:hypothetical protein
MDEKVGEKNIHPKVLITFFEYFELTFIYDELKEFLDSDNPEYVWIMDQDLRYWSSGGEEEPMLVTIDIE